MAARRLRLLLLVIAGVSALAVFPAFFPQSWLAAIQRQLGLGELPDTPVTRYLTHSLSMLYTFHALALWVAASDVRHYRWLITASAGYFLAFGGYSLALDIWCGLPWWWTLSEGPVVIALAVAMLLLQRRVTAEGKG